MNAAEEPSLDVEAVDAPERDRDVSEFSEPLTASNPGSSGMELVDWFEFGDLGWSDRDATDLDIALADLCPSDVMDQDSRIQVSMAASDERFSPDLQMRNRKNPVNHMSNKNALAARLNRLKKKEHVNNLERKVGILLTENGTLKQENCQLSKRVEELEDETRYLRAVLANQSVLAQLLSRLSGVNGMKLSCSLFQNSNSNDHDYALPRKQAKVKEKKTSGGVCLHVDQNHVSVEFCRECAESASNSLGVYAAAVRGGLGSEGGCLGDVDVRTRDC